MDFIAWNYIEALIFGFIILVIAYLSFPSSFRRYKKQKKKATNKKPQIKPGTTMKIEEKSD